MNDQPLYQDSDIVVTSSILVYRNNHYPLTSIKSVVFFKEPLDVMGLLINAVILLVGLFGIFTFYIICVGIGLLAVVICGYNLYNDYIDITNPNYTVAIELHSGESVYVKRRDMAWAQKLRDTLHLALRG